MQNKLLFCSNELCHVFCISRRFVGDHFNRKRIAEVVVRCRQIVTPETYICETENLRRRFEADAKSWFIRPVAISVYDVGYFYESIDVWTHAFIVFVGTRWRRATEIYILSYTHCSIYARERSYNSLVLAYPRCTVRLWYGPLCSTDCWIALHQA